MPGGDSSEPAGQVITTSNSDPWEGQQGYLTTGFTRAKSDILNKPLEYYPNSTVVPFSNQTEQALGMQENRALQGSPVNAAANQQLQNTASGMYAAQGNPHLQGAIDAASSGITRNYMNAVAPSVDSAFAKAGRYGSGLHANAKSQAQQDLAGQLADVGAGMAYQNYGDERTNMLRAAALAPQAAMQDYTDIAQLGAVGQQREAQAGRELQEQINRFDFEQRAPQDAVARYMALVGGGNYGNQTTQASPYFNQSPLSTGLGTAATAAGIAGSLFGQGGMFGSGGFFGGG